MTATVPDDQLDEVGYQPDLYDRVRDTPVGRSIWRTPRKMTPRDRAASHWSSFALHIYPVKIRQKELASSTPGISA